MSDEDKLVIAYLKECGQLQADLDWMTDVLSRPDPSPFFKEIGIEIIYKDALLARRIIRGEAQGKPEVLAKIGVKHV